MTKKTQEFEKRNPDFAVGELYNFVLAYVTGPEILKHDDPKLIGIPFMFFIGDISDNYMGIKMEDIAARLKKKGIPYLSHSKFNDIFEDAHITFKAPPNIVYAGDKEITLEELVGNIIRPDSCSIPGCLPNFFGLLLKEPKFEGRIKVRSEEDYKKMKEQILPEVRRERAGKEFYASRLNRLLNHLSLSEPPKTPIDDQIRYYRYGGDPLF